MRLNKKAKFITVDGFNEIESLSFKNKNKRANKAIKLNAKAVRFAKRLAKEIAGAADSAVSNLNALKAVKAFCGRLAVSTKKQASKPAFHFSARATTATILVAVVCFGVTSQIGVFASSDNSEYTPLPNKIVLQKANDMAGGGLAQAVENNETAALASADEIGDYFGLYIDGCLAGAVDDEQSLNDALDNLLYESKEDYGENAEADFTNDIEIVQGNFASEFIFTADELVAESLDRLSVTVTTEVEHTEAIDFETERKYDENEYDDYEETIQEGVTGERKTVCRLTYVDGEEVKSEVLSDEITKEAVNKIVVVGTMEKPATGVATGSFMWPVPYTSNITSYYGYRWGTIHSGIDIADSGCYGQTIVASDGGTVTWAGYDNSGYGYYVIIDHGNGYETLYAHCSELYVSEGQAVAQGEAVAAIGSTGDSTGNHLHFEVRCGGDRLDPMNYL